MNIELQAKMIEELLVKNAQLADENVQAQHMQGPFVNNDSLSEGHSATYGMPTSGRDGVSAQGSYRDNIKISQDDTFSKFASLKSIEYIHQQFYAQKHSREA